MKTGLAMRGRLLFRRFPHEEAAFAIMRNHPPAQPAAQQTDGRSGQLDGSTGGTHRPATRAGPAVPLHVDVANRIATALPELIADAEDGRLSYLPTTPSLGAKATQSLLCVRSE